MSDFYEIEISMTDREIECAGALAVKAGVRIEPFLEAQLTREIEREETTPTARLPQPDRPNTDAGINKVRLRMSEDDYARLRGIADRIRCMPSVWVECVLACTVRSR